jgi:hypothetical protein
LAYPQYPQLLLGHPGANFYLDLAQNLYTRLFAPASNIGMRCAKGIELEQAHADAERDCVNAFNTVKTARKKEKICMAALDKAVRVQVARDSLLAHIAKCKICT